MKGFWIPIGLMELDISWTKRILLAEISQLEMLDKGCVASNNHFAEKLKLTKQAVSKALNELAEDGLIIIDNAQTKRNFGRKITINFSKSAINFSKSGVHESGESKENKTKNKTNNPYDTFISYLKSKCKYKTKVSKTKEGKKLFNQIEDKKQLIKDYIRHQEEKKEFSSRITAFMEDYETVYKNKSTSSENSFDGWTY